MSLNIEAFCEDHETVKTFNNVVLMWPQRAIASRVYKVNRLIMYRLMLKHQTKIKSLSKETRQKRARVQELRETRS